MKNIEKRLDEGLRHTIQYIPTIIHEHFANNEIEKAREAFAQFVAPGLEMAEQIKEVVCEKRSIQSSIDQANIDLYVYSPVDNSDKLPVLYWIHGGGLVIGGAKLDELLLKSIVQTVGCKVVSVEYRLPPETPFPLPLEDCYDGLKHIFQAHNDLGIDPNKVVIGGDSAGGGLTAALAQLTRDRGELSQEIAAQLLIYPMLDDRNTNPLEEGQEDHYLWNKASNIYGWTSYLGMKPGTNETPKYASAARTEDLTNLPPATILVGELDLFCLEDIAYASRLIACGVSTELHVYPGAYHGSQGLNPDIFVSQEHNKMVLSALQRAFAK